MTISRVSLFDVENVETMPKVRDMTVGPVANSDLVEFTQRYHYTRARGGDGHRWGLWHGPVLHGVVNYNLPTRTVCESVFGHEHGHQRVWHMSRLVLSDDSPRNSESRLIGGSLRAIEHEHPFVWAVVTYAATDAGHIGTVYQATNALYTGQIKSSIFYIDPAGRRRATYRDGWAVTAKSALEMGWVRHEGGPKHRYVYILGSKTQRRQRRNLLRYDVLPYPKAGAA